MQLKHKEIKVQLTVTTGDKGTKRSTLLIILSYKKKLTIKNPWFKDDTFVLPKYNISMYLFTSYINKVFVSEGLPVLSSLNYMYKYIQRSELF